MGFRLEQRTLASALLHRNVVIVVVIGLIGAELLLVNQSGFSQRRSWWFSCERVGSDLPP